MYPASANSIAQSKEDRIFLSAWQLKVNSGDTAFQSNVREVFIERQHLYRFRSKEVRVMGAEKQLVIMGNACWPRIMGTLGVDWDMEMNLPDSTISHAYLTACNGIVFKLKENPPVQEFTVRLRTGMLGRPHPAAIQLLRVRPR